MSEPIGSDGKIFASDVSLGVNEANRSTEETKLHNLFDFFVGSFELAVGSSILVVFLSNSFVMSLSSILLFSRKAARFFGQLIAFSIGV